MDPMFDVKELLARGEREAALDLLLTRGDELGATDDFQALLDEAVPRHPWREAPPTVDLAAGWDGLRELHRDDSERRGEWLYALPEVGRVDGSLLPTPEKGARSGRTTFDTTLFTTPERIGKRMPLARPARYTESTFDAPELTLGADGVLWICQTSDVETYKHRSNEWIHLVVYRVRGALLHARNVRYCWSK